MENSTYHSILKDINGIKNIQEVSRIGLCRVWSKAIMEMVKSSFPQVSVEAREVDLEPNLQHTFLRVTIGNQKPFLIDGVGSAKFSPFFGYEDEAPEHLQNSRADVINIF